MPTPTIDRGVQATSQVNDSLNRNTFDPFADLSEAHRRVFRGELLEIPHDVFSARLGDGNAP